MATEQNDLRKLFPLKLKTSPMKTVLPPCELDITFLRSLFKMMDECNMQAIDEEIKTLVRKPDETEEEFESLKENYANCQKVSIQISSPNEVIFQQDDSILHENSFPSKVNKIVIDNTALFQYFLYRNPKNSMRVEFDFRKVKVLDFRAESSGSTENTSALEITGTDKTWVEGVHKRIINSINDRKNNRKWLHLDNTYLVFVWFIILPYIFWKVSQLAPFFSRYVAELSSFLQVAIYVYIVFILLFFARILFNFARWLFPYMELESKSDKGFRKLTKGFWLIAIPSIMELIVRKIVPFLF